MLNQRVERNLFLSATVFHIDKYLYSKSQIPYIDYQVPFLYLDYIYILH